MNYTEPKYDKYRIWMRDWRENGRSWDDLEKGLPDMYDTLYIFLDTMRKISAWQLDEEGYKIILKQERSAEEESKEFEEVVESALLVDEHTVSDISIPQLPNSAWQKYRARLTAKGFRKSSIAEIEQSTLTILKMLHRDNKEVRKGMVMGNVQSGKTANMAALMAMAADWGWNMFIILSGTIENLRIQTQNRLLDDLARDNSTITWRGIERPSKRSETNRTSDIKYKNGSANFTVCLKNKKRLEDLIEWLQDDQKKKSHMKIIVIDDEADQAGINTADVTSEERKTINGLIVNLVRNCDKKGYSKPANFMAMNYIGYTATPYANFLNESAEESLYPSSFIATLRNAPEYFGPQSIFGIEGIGTEENVEQFDGLDIKREVTKENLLIISEIHKGSGDEMPDSMKHAVAWFLSGTAALRVQGFKKPLSMLVHTSHKQDHHQYIAESIEKWIVGSTKEVMKVCEYVYNLETSIFTKENFIKQKPEYPDALSISNYLSFGEIVDELEYLISNITPIPLDDEHELDYQKTIHLCIDNCANNGIDDEGMFKRLVYPTNEKLKKLDCAPAFIVVGGATLSRGLTIEGLISTYFLRQGRQGDTLMQMGRWFGYRKGYELYPRIWMTNTTMDQFRYLSTLDYELRNEIKTMMVRGIAPKEYGPKIRNIPKVNSMKITALNKMQSAQYTDLDFSGSHNQTVVFEANKEIQISNINTTEEFLIGLGTPQYSSDKTALIWNEVECKRIFEKYLLNFNFASNNVVFSNIKSLYEWVNIITHEGKLKNWNVVVAGLKQDNAKTPVWKIGNHTVTAVTRTRRKTIGNKLDIGVLRAPRDLSADIDMDSLDDTKAREIKKFKDTEYNEKRRIAGLERVPQLLIYRIDKDSTVESSGGNRENSKRKDLNTAADLIGICITIPGARETKDYAKSVTIKLDHAMTADDFENI